MVNLITVPPALAAIDHATTQLRATLALLHKAKQLRDLSDPAALELEKQAREKLLHLIIAADVAWLELKSFDLDASAALEQRSFAGQATVQ